MMSRPWSPVVRALTCVESCQPESKRDESQTSDDDDEAASSGSVSCCSRDSTRMAAMASTSTQSALEQALALQDPQQRQRALADILKHPAGQPAVSLTSLPTVRTPSDRVDTQGRGTKTCSSSRSRPSSNSQSSTGTRETPTPSQTFSASPGPSSSTSQRQRRQNSVSRPPCCPRTRRTHRLTLARASPHPPRLVCRDSRQHPDPDRGDKGERRMGQERQAHLSQAKPRNSPRRPVRGPPPSLRVPA